MAMNIVTLKLSEHRRFEVRELDGELSYGEYVDCSNCVDCEFCECYDLCGDEVIDRFVVTIERERG